MQNMVIGNLIGLEETKISIGTRKAGVQVYPRKELDISLDWVFEHMGKQVMCQLKDGVVTQVRAIG